jgi:tetratricopeptide (TPR) repeat protein
MHNARHIDARLSFAVAMVCLAGCVSSAHGESVRSRLEQAQTHLRANDSAKALEIYRELQVEHPESEPAVFGAGCAQYVQGESKLALNAGEEAVAAFAEARASFERLVGSRNPEIRANAAFNRANCIAQTAKLTAANPEQYEAGVAALREAAAAYGVVLKEFPDHAGAKQNLDHVQYLLKKMLQNPPEKKEQDKDQKEPPKDEDQPKPVSVFIRAATELPGAEAQIHPESDTVELVPPGQGGQP